MTNTANQTIKGSLQSETKGGRKAGIPLGICLGPRKWWLVYLLILPPKKVATTVGPPCYFSSLDAHCLLAHRIVLRIAC